MKTVQVINITSTSHKVNLVCNSPFFFSYTSACFCCSTISLLDESEEEGMVKLLIKEEEEVEVM